MRCRHCCKEVADLSDHYASHPSKGGCTAIAIALTDYWPFKDHVAERNSKNRLKARTVRGRTISVNAESSARYRKGNICPRCQTCQRQNGGDYCQTCQRTKDKGRRR